MADGNADNAVNLMEVGRYLEDHVTDEEVRKPKSNGGREQTEKLTDVFPELLAQIKEGKKGQMQLFTATDSRVKLRTTSLRQILLFENSMRRSNRHWKIIYFCRLPMLALISITIN